MAIKNNARPLVSIVILNWNGLEDTKSCLEHVRMLDYPNYEIIVVDNGSRQDQKDYLSSLEDIIFVDNPVNRGFAGGQADGYKVAKGDFILLLNNDAVIKSNYLAEAIPLFNDPSVAVVGGRAYFWNETELLLNESNRFYSYMEVSPFTAETTMLMEDYGTIQEVNNVSGSAVLVRTSVIQKVGYLQESFFAYYEETDLFARIKRAGYKVLYSPTLRIWHRNGASSGAQGGSFFFFYHIFRNRFMFAIRNYEQHYLKKFLIRYYSSGLQAIIQIPNGPVQRRLGFAYAKAMIVTLMRLPSLSRERASLKKLLGTSKYNRQTIAEQIRLSIVLDCRARSKLQLENMLEQLAHDTNPLHEYVLVVNNVPPVRLPKNARTVVDRGYFDVHPINLGCIAARMPWIIVAETISLQDILNYHAQIADTVGTTSKLISLGPENSSLAIAKDYYQKMGGLSYDSRDLLVNLDSAYAYASADKKTNQPDTHDEHSSPLVLQKIAYDNLIFKDREGGSFDHFLAHHYRLYQLNNLLKWLVSSDVRIRLKAARIKNLLLFTSRLDRPSLATELRHIKNEVQLSASSHLANVILDKQRDSLQLITTKLLRNPLDTPVFIICFERVESLKILITWLEIIGIRKIILIDNDSSYPPLLKFYDETDKQVLKLQRNIGHVAPWSLDIIRILIPENYYVITDPDVIPSEDCPADVLEHFAKIHAEFPAYQKIGFGLRVDDLPNHYPLKKEVIEWEKQFWVTQLSDNVYDAPIDTTFALYKPYTYKYILAPSIRTGTPYVARHLPWYNNPDKISPEEIYYRNRASTSVTSWNVDELPDRYKEEMKSSKEDNHA